MYKILFFLFGFFLSSTLCGQEYDPYEPFEYLASNSQLPITYEFMVYNESRTEKRGINFRSKVLYKGDNYRSGRKKTSYYAMDWRSETVFAYLEINVVDDAAIEKEAEDINVKQYDVRDFLSADKDIVWKRGGAYSYVTFHTWVPMGIVDGLDYNNEIRVAKGAKRLSDETAQLELVKNPDFNKNGELTIQFENNQKALIDELIEKIKLYGKNEDPYLGSENPLVYTLNSFLDETISLPEGIENTYRDGNYTYLDYQYIENGNIYLANVTKEFDEDENKTYTTAIIKVIPKDMVDKIDFEFTEANRVVKVWEVRLMSNQDNVVDNYTFGVRRGICSHYKESSSATAYFKTKEEMDAFLAKLENNTIESIDLNAQNLESKKEDMARLNTNIDIPSSIFCSNNSLTGFKIYANLEHPDFASTNGGLQGYEIVLEAGGVFFNAEAGLSQSVNFNKVGVYKTFKMDENRFGKKDDARFHFLFKYDDDKFVFEHGVGCPCNLAHEKQYPLFKDGERFYFENGNGLSFSFGFDETGIYYRKYDNITQLYRIEESEDKLYIYKNGESTPIYYCKSSGALCTNLAALGVIYLEGLVGPTMTKDKY